MNKCSYCGCEHGMIGDTVCPIPLATSDFYQRKHKPVFVTYQYFSGITIVRLMKTIDPDATHRKKYLSGLFINITDEYTYQQVKERAGSGKWARPLASMKAWEAKVQNDSSQEKACQ